jgi:uncharacterized protein (DUF362 family)
MSARVALVRGGDRRENLLRALELIEGDVRLGGRIVVKPNIVSIAKPLAVTHAEALGAVLEFLRARTAAPITVAEGSASASTLDGFALHGYREAAARFGATLVDLNRDRWVEVDLVDRDWRPMRLRVARTIAESDLRVSLALPKTHDVVGVTLALKNLAMGGLIRRHADVGRRLDRLIHSLGHILRPRDALVPRRLDPVVRWLIRSDKLRMHQTYETMNWNLHLLARAFPAGLAVLDGFVGMEGEGPTSGDPVDLRVAIASADPVACDAVGARVMGFDPGEIGYLHHTARAGLGEIDPGRIEVLGDRIEDCRRPFRPHPHMERQKAWRNFPDPVSART